MGPSHQCNGHLEIEGYLKQNLSRLRRMHFILPASSARAVGYGEFTIGVRRDVRGRRGDSDQGPGVSPPAGLSISQGAAGAWTVLKQDLQILITGQGKPCAGGIVQPNLMTGVCPAGTIIPSIHISARGFLWPPITGHCVGNSGWDGHGRRSITAVHSLEQSFCKWTSCGWQLSQMASTNVHNAGARAPRPKAFSLWSLASLSPGSRLGINHRRAFIWPHKCSDSGNPIIV